MKILIVGKNGQVGMSLIDAAKLYQEDFVAIGRKDLDITDQNAVDEFFFREKEFDFVINAAAYTNVDGAEKEADVARAVNVNGVIYLATACKRYDIPFIHISTDYIFDGQKVTGYDEDDLPNPKNKYGLTKLEGENALKTILDKHIILRVSWVFSEYGKNFVKTIAKIAEEKDNILVVCDQYGSPTSAKSIASVIIEICRLLLREEDRKKYWGTYHYTDFPATNWHQLATHVIRKKNKNKKIVISGIESKDYITVAQRPKFSILNTKKINNVFYIEQRCWLSEVDRIVKLL